MKVCIIGLAKSGTSALYRAVQREMPEDTRFVFEPGTGPELDYVLAGPEDGLTKVMFTNLNKCGYDSSRFDKNIFIVRDPRDIMVSSIIYRFNRLSVINRERKFKKLLKLFRKKEKSPARMPMTYILDQFQEDGATTFRTNFTRAYSRLIDTSSKIENKCVVKYEDFIRNDVAELSNYLDLEVAKPDRLDGWIDKISRKGTSGDWRNWLVKDDVEFLAPAVNPILQQLGYNDDWSLAEPQLIRKEHCSDYILHLARMRKLDPNIEQPEALTMEMLTSAARDGKKVALFRLGRKYLRGEDCEKNLDKAQDCLSKAVAMAHEPALFWLAECHRQQRNIDTAIQLFKQAGEKGYAQAYWKLGLIYRRNPARRDPATSRKYFEIGVGLGNKKCKEELARIAE